MAKKQPLVLLTFKHKICVTATTRQHLQLPCIIWDTSPVTPTPSPSPAAAPSSAAWSREWCGAGLCVLLSSSETHTHKDTLCSWAARAPRRNVILDIKFVSKNIIHHERMNYCLAKASRGTFSAVWESEASAGKLSNLCLFL